MTVAVTAIAAAPAHPAAKVRPDHDGTTIARAASVVARPGLRAVRHAPRVTVVNLSAAQGLIFAGVNRVNVARRPRRCRTSTSACAPRTKASNPLRARSR